MSGIVRACVRGCNCARVRVCEGAMRKGAMREGAKHEGAMRKGAKRERAKNHNFLFLAVNGHV